MVEELKFVFGAANCTRLNKFRNSVSNNRLTRSVIGVDLVTAKSKVFIPSVRNVGSVRLSVPKLNCPG